MTLVLRKATDWLPFITVALCCVVTLLAAYAVSDYIGGKNDTRHAVEVGCAYDEKLSTGLRLILGLSADAARKRYESGLITSEQLRQNLEANRYAEGLIANPECKVRIGQL